MLIGLSAKAMAGKNQLAEFIIEEFEKNHGRKFYESSFANELKYMCKFQFGLNDDQLWGNKKEWADERFPRNKWKHLDGGTMMYWTPREIMQELGAFYRKIDCDFWIKSLKKFLSSEMLKGRKDFIITDVRHINEAEFIKNGKGLLVRISREVKNEIHGIDHESETGLDNYKEFDIYIDNNGSLDNLRKAGCDIVGAILSMEKLMNNRRVI